MHFVMHGELFYRENASLLLSISKVEKAVFRIWCLL